MDDTKTPKAELYRKGRNYWKAKCERIQNALDCANRNVESKNGYIEQKKRRIEQLCESLERAESKAVSYKRRSVAYLSIAYAELAVFAMLVAFLAKTAR